MANDIHISGSGTVAAGEYGKVHISGSGYLQGDVACEALHVSGSARADGSLRVEEEGRVSGSISCKGPVEAGALSVSGACAVEGNLTARELRVSGGAKIAGDLQADEAKISGGLKVGGMARGGKLRSSGGLHASKGIECEELRTSGAFTSEGLVNAGVIEISLGGECRLDEVGCEEISVRRGEEGIVSGFLRALSGRERRLQANLIEGTRVYLEYTVCKVVRGQRVEIGPGCEIGRVEYTDSLTVSPESSVAEQARTGEA